MSAKERSRWANKWKKLVWSSPKYRRVFVVSFIVVLLLLGGGIGCPLFLHAQKLRDKILIPVWCFMLSAMFAHLIQYAASAREMRAKISAARGGKSLDNKPA